jgi:glycosyltransferase involved in cell wall biosynthesis
MQSIFFISEVAPEKYPAIDQHYKWVPIHEPHLTFERFSELWHIHKPYCVYTYGTFSNNLFGMLSHIYQVRKCWIHLSNLDDLDITPNVFAATLKHQYDDDNPLMSIISSSYYSKEKILRPLRSLQGQSYTNWEWIIWDDSETDETYKQLLEMQKRDLRIRVYKAPYHSGIIGEMKRLAAGVAYGSFIVEVDHDDDLHPDLLKWILDASRKYADAEFFYTECSEVVEDTYTSISYGNFFGLGYCAHMNIWSDLHKCYITSTVGSTPNGTSLRHIVGVPNHVRAWKTGFYDAIGKHNPKLSVADDYELLLRSFLHGKWCYIRKCGYYQYRNKDGNFTFIRNSLIQHNVHHIARRYDHLLPPRVPGPNRPVWSYDEQEYEPVHYEYVPDPVKKTIVLMGSPTKEVVGKYIAEGNRIFIMGVLPDIPDAWKPQVCWWTPPTENREDSIRYVKKFFHVGEEFIVAEE